jgi:hypothetical protein
VEPHYPSHGILALSELARLEGSGQDIFYLEESSCPINVFKSNLFKSWLGPDWTDRFIVHEVKACASLAICGERLRLGLSGRRPAHWDEFEKRPHLELEAIDEVHMTIPFMHDQEQRMWEGTSLHFHRRCDDAGQHSCSVICDMAAQQLLNVVFNSQKPYRRDSSPRTTPNTGDGGYRLCLRCPVELVPFTIIPHFHGVTCMDHLPLG